MAKVINNTDLDKISQTVANGKDDKESLRRPVKLIGEWNLDPTDINLEQSYRSRKEKKRDRLTIISRWKWK